MTRAQEIKDWKETAANINNSGRAYRERLGNHLLAKYQRLEKTMVDRLEMLAAGYKCDHTLVQMCEYAGISL